MLATSRFWRLTVWGWSLYDSWLTSFWRIWVKWYFIKHAVVAFFLFFYYWLVSALHLATGPRRLVNRRIEQRQEHSITHTEITQRYRTAWIITQSCMSAHHLHTFNQTSLHAHLTPLGLATLYIFAIFLNMCVIKYFSVIMYNLRVWNKKLPSCLSTEHLSWLCL